MKAAEFEFIRRQAQKLGIRDKTLADQPMPTMKADPTTGWDIQPSPITFATHISPTQDADIVIDGSEKQAAELEAAPRGLHLQGPRASGKFDC